MSEIHDDQTDEFDEIERYDRRGFRDAEGEIVFWKDARLSVLALRRDLAEAGAEIERIQEELRMALWAVAKMFPFIHELFKTGWTPEVQRVIDTALGGGEES